VPDQDLPPPSDINLVRRVLALSGSTAFSLLTEEEQTAAAVRILESIRSGGSIATLSVGPSREETATESSIKRQIAILHAEHRMGIENKMIDAQIRQSDRGQWMALCISVFSITASVIVTLYGQPAVGGILGGSTVLGLAGAFIAGKISQSKSLVLKKAARNTTAKKTDTTTKKT
jgi:hypothetical protein